MSLESLLPWVTSIAGIAVMGLAGKAKTRRFAWILGVCNQLPWVTFAVVTGSWGFIPGSCAYALVYLRNLRKGD